MLPIALSHRGLNTTSHTGPKVPVSHGRHDERLVPAGDGTERHFDEELNAVLAATHQHSLTAKSRKTLIIRSGSLAIAYASHSDDSAPMIQQPGRGLGAAQETR